MVENLSNSKNFNDFVNSIKVGDYQNIIKDVQHYCGISRATLSLWRRGKTTPNQASKRIINALSAKYGYAPVYDIDDSFLELTRN